MRCRICCEGKYPVFKLKEKILGTTVAGLITSTARIEIPKGARFTVCFQCCMSLFQANLFIEKTRKSVNPRGKKGDNTLNGTFKSVDNGSLTNDDTIGDEDDLDASEAKPKKLKKTKDHANTDSIARGKKGDNTLNGTFKSVDDGCSLTNNDTIGDEDDLDALEPKSKKLKKMKDHDITDSIADANDSLNGENTDDSKDKDFSYSWPKTETTQTGNSESKHDKTPCLVCNKKFSSGARLDAHMQKAHAATESFDCPNCALKFRSKDKYDSHVFSEKCSNSIYPCQEESCHKKFANMKAMKAHMQKFHPLSVFCYSEE